MKKRAIALLMATVMVLAGCGQAQDAETSKESEASKETSTASSESSASSEVVEESKYPEYLNLDGYRPIVKEGEEITLTAVTKRSGQATTDVNEEIWFTKFIEEKLNINLEIEEPKGDAYNERRSLMFASGELPDLLLYYNISNQDIINYGVEGEMLLPISDYFSEELTPNIMDLLETYPEIKDMCTAPDGKIYQLPQVSVIKPGVGSTIGRNQLTWIDKEYLTATGRTEAPTSLDDFVDMLRDIKALDPETMGVDEVYPWVSTMGYDNYYLTAAFGWIGSYGGNASKMDPYLDTKTGELVIPVTQEEKFTDWVTLWNTLYKEGLIHKDIYTLDDEGKRAFFAEKSVGVVGDSTTETSRPGEIESFVLAAPLTSKWSDTAVVEQGDRYSHGYTVVSADTEYPELCVRFIDYLYSPEGSLYAMHGPLADSDDGLGMLEGVSANLETGAVKYHDVESGKFESAWIYMVQGLKTAFGLSTNENAAYEYLYENSGSEWSQDLVKMNYQQQMQYDTAKGHMVDRVPNVFLSSDVVEEYTDLYTVLKDHLDAEFAKFVVGQRPLEEVPEFFEELKAMGLADYVEIINNAYAEYEWNGIIE